jgi:hypothetical protein
VLRKSELQRVLGRRLTDRLVKATWIEPVCLEGRCTFYDPHAVHLALKRLANQGHLLNGNARSRSTGTVRKSANVPSASLDEVLATIEL